MTTSSPVKKEYDIPIILPDPEPKKLNPGIPAPLITRPVPVKVPVRKRIF